MSLARRLAAEALGTGLLFATVIGSGIMAEQLAGGNVAVALLGNTLPIAAMLFVLITLFGPVSGAQFNPAVTLVVWRRGGLGGREAGLYVLAQLAGGLIGVLVTHGMFELPLLQLGVKPRGGPGQWLGEAVATFALVLTVLGTLRYRPEQIALTVAAVILAACWFTSSTSFANPAITIMRALTDSFTGIRPADVPAFIAAQIAGALLADACARLLFAEDEP